MEKNVFMASMAFLVPLQGSSLRFRKICKNGQKIGSPYVLFPNAECEYYCLENWLYTNHFFPLTFTYTSCYNGIDSIEREIDIKPIFMRLCLKDKRIKRYFLVLTIQIDKVFGHKQVYDDTDFCTEFDIVNLKKSLFENRVSGCYAKHKKSISFQEWVRDIASELEGRKNRTYCLSYSAIDISLQNLNVSNTGNDIKAINNSFKEKYYSGGDINNFLQSNIVLPSAGCQKSQTLINNEHFVYGLIYANSNFMMASANAVKRTINDYYSNNKVEKYWADDECLVHIKTGTPYYCPKEKNIQSLNGNLEKELPILFDLAILAFIKNELLTFLVDHQNMSVSEIDNVQSIIARILYCKLFNQTELDKRMDYFIRKFHLVNLFENIKCTILPIKDIKEINFLRRTTYLTLMVAGLTLLATIIGIIVSLNS